MKPSVFVAFSIILLCSLSFQTVLVNAYYTGYETTNYQTTTTMVTDGAWTTNDEWTVAMAPPLLPATFHWRQVWTWPEDIFEHFLIEFFTDNTTDPGDYYQICIDCDANGGTVPDASDIRVDYVGHSDSGLTVYRGTGSGWAVFTDYTLGTDIAVEESLGSSPLEEDQHWIVEIRMNRSKAEFDVSTPNYAPWIRLAVYDQSNDTQGVQAWPPTSRDVPQDWGLETGTTEAIPESLTIISVVALSVVALLVSSYLLRSRPVKENAFRKKTIEN